MSSLYGDHPLFNYDQYLYVLSITRLYLYKDHPRPGRATISRFHCIILLPELGCDTTRDANTHDTKIASSST